ncbi:glycine zipper 2TM domain-containing protein [Sphingomonas psychrolutea]|uniref:17 kDa surface antigen n=1 Tax=Sphingomonas psychrolutea TaxID=1259676 RepID=A0ABQ1G7F7_9SPHN|nr:glycine zipper 2TM domain-containing protein [Sphingomonas psychrolutea]GGA38209.1 hypothetical protein GCM10011395_05590 [Sphingomonas psychrolutea]
MKFKRSILAAFGVAAIAVGLPTVASAQSSITFSIGSGYDSRYSGAPGYGYDAYPDFARSGYYDDNDYDDAPDYDGYNDRAYSEDVYVGRPYYDRRTEIYSRQGYRRPQRCTSGTTGAILGAVVGGLLGGEVGRGGYYNERSTTGTIVGAGAGALAGRAIEQDGCR